MTAARVAHERRRGRTTTATLALFIAPLVLAGAASRLPVDPASAAASAGRVARVSAPRAEQPRLAVARLQYDGGGDWYANPSSLPNLITAIADRTSLKI